MCMMHRTLEACINGYSMGMGQQGAATDPMGMMYGMADPIEVVCAWNPFTGMCKDGQLEEEPGDSGWGLGAGANSGCAWGIPNEMTCPRPLCQWTGSSCISSGMNWEWKVVVPLQKNSSILNSD
eukprot:TRINITY_DN1644_c0_g1_i1.p2 TRINITY_DN1644_c0_g1~~TRINITY_DN1644_c0_g1_i1.p2  ORF type:complete len:124 (-),score=15.45 TRINITY_DN1644_c0_g1_i1:455-826(-)